MYLPTRLPETETRATDDPVAQTLLRAAQVIRERGWCQGQLFEGKRVCAVGAVCVAVGRTDKSAMPAVNALERYIGWTRASAWNDAPGRTADEVIAALERAAISRATAVRGV